MSSVLGKKKPPYKRSFLYGGSFISNAKDSKEYESYQIERIRAIHRP